MKTTSRSLVLLVAVFAFGLPVLAQTSLKPNATSILNNMFRVYSRSTSYQDEGILVTTRDEPTGGTIEKMPFKTFFKRPNLFRFEWTDYGATKLGRTKMIWFDGKQAFTYWEPDYYEKEESLNLAIAGVSGVSDEAVNTVSDLLMPDRTTRSTLKKLVNVSVLGEEIFEGVRCYRIKGKEGNSSLELWIGKTDFLLRKLRKESKYENQLRIHEETRRKILLDRSIGEVVFNYKPPIPLTPLPKTDVDLDKLINPGPPVWTEFRSEEGLFTILMPQKPISNSSTVETSQGRFEHRSFHASHDALNYGVSYVDIPKTLMVANDVDGFFDGAQGQFIKEVGGKLTSATPMPILGYPGREVKVQLYRGQLRMRMFLVRDRLYVLTVMSLTKALDTEEETLKTFFTSFKLNPTDKPIAVLRDRARRQSSRS